MAASFFPSFNMATARSNSARDLASISTFSRMTNPCRPSFSRSTEAPVFEAAHPEKSAKHKARTKAVFAQRRKIAEKDEAFLFLKDELKI
jgi:hypothetical protein